MKAAVTGKVEHGLVVERGRAWPKDEPLYANIRHSLAYGGPWSSDGTRTVCQYTYVYFKAVKDDGSDASTQDLDAVSGQQKYDFANYNWDCNYDTGEGNENTGTVTGTSPDTLTDNTKNWGANGWAPGVVKIIAGTGAGQIRRVTENTASTLTVTPDWDTQPAGADYDVIKTSTWTQDTSVSGDNQNGNGTTSRTWNLQ